MAQVIGKYLIDKIPVNVKFFASLTGTIATTFSLLGAGLTRSKSRLDFSTQIEAPEQILAQTRRQLRPISRPVALPSLRNTRASFERFEEQERQLQEERCKYHDVVT